VANGYAEDMDQKKPDVMFVDASPGFMGKLQSVTVIDFLSAVPSFKKAWSHYRYATTFDYCIKDTRYVASECKYDLYRRIP
jgi:hypothetical protein